MHTEKILFIFDPFDENRCLDHILLDIFSLFSSLKYQITVYGNGFRRDEQLTLKQLKEYNLVICYGSRDILNKAISLVVLPLEDIPIIYISNRVPDTLLPGIAERKLDINFNDITQRINIGKLNGNFFIYEAAFGILSYRHNSRWNMVRALSSLRDLYRELRYFRKIPSYHAIITSGNIKMEGEYISIYFRNAQMNDDGVFEMEIIEKPQSISEHFAVIHYIIGGNSPPPCIHLLKRDRVHICSNDIEWTLDGVKKIVSNDTTILMLKQYILAAGI